MNNNSESEEDIPSNEELLKEENFAQRGNS